MKAYPLFLFFILGFSLKAQVFIKGTVLDREDHSPVIQALIEVHETEQRITTDGKGFFSFEIRPGNYHIHIQASGYEAHEFDLSARKDTSLLIKLKPTFIELREVLVEESFSKNVQRNTSLDIEYITPEESEKNTESSFAESLKKIPGLEALNTGVGIAKPIIRGFMATRVSVYDQGIKQEGQQWGMDHGLEIDPFNAGRVEIVKGPGALQYGSDAVGGVVKILPEALPDEGLSGNYTTLYKTNNNTLGNSLKLAYRKGRHHFSGRVSYQKFNDYRVPADEFLYNGYILPVVDHRLKNTAGDLLSYRLHYGLHTSRFNTRILFSRYQQQAGLYPGATGIPRAYEVADIGSVKDIDLPNQEVMHTKLYSEINIKIKDNWLRTNIGYQQNDRSENSVPHSHGYVQIDSSSTLALGLSLQTLSFNSNYNWSAGSIKYTLGTHHQYMRNTKSGWEYLLPDFTSYNGAFFGTAEGMFGEKWNWNGGIRLDYGDIQSQQHLQPWFEDPDSLVERSPDMNRHFLNYALGWGLAYNPEEEWNFKLNLARSFRIPVPAELAANGVHHGTFRHEIGNAGMNAEKGYQLDLTAAYIQKRFYVKLTPFLNYFDNYIYLRPGGRFSPLPDAGQLYQYSQTEALHSGGELFAEYHILPELHLSDGIEYVYNLNLETGLPLPFTPPLSNLFSLRYDFGRENKINWSAGIEHRWVSAQERTDRNEQPTPGYQLFNLKANATFPLGEISVKTSISALNIFNTPYLNHLSRYRILNLPEQGRNIVFHVNVEF